MAFYHYHTSSSNHLHFSCIFGTRPILHVSNLKLVAYIIMQN